MPTCSTLQHVHNVRPVGGVARVGLEVKWERRSSRVPGVDPARLKRIATSGVDRFAGRAERIALASGGADRGTQVALALAYRERSDAARPLPAFADVEFRNTSQNGEDGILLFIFALAGMGGRRVAELCASDGIECNAANLVLHHGWEALLVDGDEELIERGRTFYNRHPETHRVGPIFEHVWVTRDGAQPLLERHGFAEDLDLLSVDMDGSDYWVLEKLIVRPRVIVCEYNNRIPPGAALAVPYSDAFVAAGDLTHGEGFYGASLDAYARLLADRGYRLVGSNRHNTNAFFLRDDVLPEALPEVVPGACLKSAWARTQREKWWPTLKDKPWVQL